MVAEIDVLSDIIIGSINPVLVECVDEFAVKRCAKSAVELRSPNCSVKDDNVVLVNGTDSCGDLFVERFKERNEV